MMAGHFYPPCRGIWRKCSLYLLAFFFLAGLLSGPWVFRNHSALSWVDGFLNGSPSYLRLILFTFLPFLLSAFAVSCRMPGLLLGISFVKGFLFGTAAFLLVSGCGSAGWLLRFFFLFSDSLSLPLLCCFWLRYLPGDRELEPGVLLFNFAMVSLICSTDVCVISPFLAHIIVF